MGRRWLFLLGILGGCTADLPGTPLQDIFHLDVAATRSSYAPGDSVFLRVTNNDDFSFVWHRCPGVLLQRETSGGWTEVPGVGACTPGFVTLAGGGTLNVPLAMPVSAPVGRYRVQIRLSPIDAGSKQFWWPSASFSVTGS